MSQQISKSSSNEKQDAKKRSIDLPNLVVILVGLIIILLIFGHSRIAGLKDQLNVAQQGYFTPENGVKYDLITSPSTVIIDGVNHQLYTVKTPEGPRSIVFPTEHAKKGVFNQVWFVKNQTGFTLMRVEQKENRKIPVLPTPLQ